MDKKWVDPSHISPLSFPLIFPCFSFCSSSSSSLSFSSFSSPSFFSFSSSSFSSSSFSSSSFLFFLLLFFLPLFSLFLLFLPLFFLLLLFLFLFTWCRLETWSEVGSWRWGWFCPLSSLLQFLWGVHQHVTTQNSNDRLLFQPITQ